MPTRTRCSSCAKKLSIRDELIGKKVKCPACGAVFLAAPIGEQEQAAARPTARKVPAPLEENDEEEEANTARPLKRGAKRKKTAALPFGRTWIVGAAAIVFVAVAIGVYFLFFAGSPQTGTVAKKGPAQADGGERNSRPNRQTVSKAEPQADLAAFPELGPGRIIQPGIQFQDATLRRGAVPMRVWYYQPDKAADKLALVLVPPAGSTLFVGMDLGDGDRPEHYPYAKAGFATLSFEIDGHVPNLQAATDATLLQGARRFRDSQAGLANAKAALDFILAKAPNVDPNRIYVAGHSSAATLALLVAQHEPRIKACAAYAPVTDVESHLAQAIPSLNQALPGFRDFLRFSAPKTHTDKLTCPVFLFHAQDDTTVPLRQTTDFAAALKKSNPNVTLVTTPSGGHYDSMIREGIPKGIAWLERIDKEGR